MKVKPGISGGIIYIILMFRESLVVTVVRWSPKPEVEVQFL